MKNTFQNFLNIYLKNGFQSLSKKDIDLLIFYFMKKNGLIKGKTNYEKARNLKITPNKFASLQVDAYMRWEDENREAVLQKFLKDAFELKNIERIVEEQQELLKKGEMALTIENAVTKLQLERTLTEINAHIRYTFNKEVIIVNIKTLFEIVYFSGIELQKIKKVLLDSEDIDTKELIIKKDFRNITFEEYRKILNEIGFESMKEIGKSFMSNIRGLV